MLTKTNTFLGVYEQCHDGYLKVYVEKPHIPFKKKTHIPFKITLAILHHRR